MLLDSLSTILILTIICSVTICKHLKSYQYNKNFIKQRNLPRNINWDSSIYDNSNIEQIQRPNYKYAYQVGRRPISRNGKKITKKNYSPRLNKFQQQQNASKGYTNIPKDVQLLYKTPEELKRKLLAKKIEYQDKIQQKNRLKQNFAIYKRKIQQMLDNFSIRQKEYYQKQRKLEIEAQILQDELIDYQRNLKNKQIVQQSSHRNDAPIIIQPIPKQDFTSANQKLNYLQNLQAQINKQLVKLSKEKNRSIKKVKKSKEQKNLKIHKNTDSIKQQTFKTQQNLQKNSLKNYSLIINNSRINKTGQQIIQKNLNNETNSKSNILNVDSSLKTKGSNAQQLKSLYTSINNEHLDAPVYFKQSKSIRGSSKSMKDWSRKQIEDYLNAQQMIK